MPQVRESLRRALKAKDRSLDLIWNARMERYVLIRRDDTGKEFVIATIQDELGGFKEPRDDELMEYLHENDVARQPGLTWADKQRNFIEGLRRKRQAKREKEWESLEDDQYQRFVKHKEIANLCDGDPRRMEIMAAKSEDNLRDAVNLTEREKRAIRNLSEG